MAPTVGPPASTSSRSTTLVCLRAQAQYSTVMPRIGVVSGRYPTTKFASPTNHKAYCDRHGYVYLHCNWPTGAENPYMNKVAFIQSYMSLFDFLFWIDDDAFFLDIDRPLDAILPTDRSFLSICASPSYKEIHTYISSGQFAIRCNEIGLRFLEEVASTDLNEVRAWWSDDLGFFSNGDQDAMTYHLLTKYEGFYDRHPHIAFNSRAEEVIGTDWHDVFVVHFTGRPEVKHRDHSSVQRYLGRPPSLLPRPLHESLAGPSGDHSPRRTTVSLLLRAVRRRLGLRYWWRRMSAWRTSRHYS